MRPPSVDALARSLSDIGLPHPLLVDAAREAIAAGDPSSARRRAEAVETALLRPVVNATGVLLHTNLGRAPLAVDVPGRYMNLEVDMETGRRGSRHHVAALLARLCGAEAAVVVNNGAGAVLLALAAVAAGRAVVVSRGELVEIGGGFRVPDVIAQSGATLLEVGTTNRTRRDDYERAIATSDDVAAVLKVHQSNYRIVGFTAAVGVGHLSALGPPVVADLGSGLLDATTPWLKGGPPHWLRDEPAVRQTLAQGAALVTFSGDKLLGGPQAGVIAGRRELVEVCTRHPLARALRPGGLVLHALQQTALAYLRGDGHAIPFWRAATMPVDVLRARAEALDVPGAEVVACTSLPGGGSLPGMEIESVGVSVAGDVTVALRRFDPPVIARAQGDRTVCDLRTVHPDDDPLLAKALAAVTDDSRTL